MRRLCSNGDGKVVRARGLCDACYHRDLYHHRLPTLPRGDVGMAVSRYTWRGVSCNDLPAVWAAEDRERRQDPETMPASLWEAI